MRQLDHSMIFVLIAGSYTPFAMLALHGPLSTAILVAVWAGALAGVVLSLAWIGAPKWLWAMLYVGLGWILLAAMPELAAAVGIGGLTLVALGGVLYTLGAVVYSLQRPDPAPAVFGYHEVFHALVIIAAALQFAVIAFWVLPG
jgi:hemolysin III